MKTGKTEVRITAGSATADYMADMLQIWRDGNGGGLDTLVINLDNGPENNMRRRHWIKRILEFSSNNNVFVALARYPPYLSKCSPVEHVWQPGAALERVHSRQC